MPYPTVPGRRMAYDEDCVATFSVSTIRNNATPVIATTVQKEWMNNENTGIVTGNPGNGFYSVFFPELREFDGLFARGNNGNIVTTVETSTDAVGPVGGAWVTQSANHPDADNSTVGRYRLDIQSFAVSNVRGVSVYSGTSWHTCHIYGEITPGQTPDRLLYIDELTALEFGLPIDYGDTARGGSIDKVFRLHNNSATLTASTVQLTTEGLYLTAATWFTMSDGGAFQSTLPLTAGSIGPSTTSAPITLRRIIPGTATLGLYAARLQASVGTWA